MNINGTRRIFTKWEAGTQTKSEERYDLMDCKKFLNNFAKKTLFVSFVPIKEIFPNQINAF